MDNENNTLFVMPTTNANDEHTNKDSHEDVALMTGTQLSSTAQFVFHNRNRDDERPSRTNENTI